MTSILNFSSPKVFKKLAEIHGFDLKEGKKCDHVEKKRIARKEKQRNGTFLRRHLPNPGIALESKEGRSRLTRSLLNDTAESFFSLVSVSQTQSEPALCGPATLAMILNSLAIDPGRLWKGPWRWFSEDLLDCCVPMETASQVGITLDQFFCSAKCNFSDGQVLLKRPVGGEGSHLSNSSCCSSKEEKPSPTPLSCCCSVKSPLSSEKLSSTLSPLKSIEEFRKDIELACRSTTLPSSSTFRLVVSYSRPSLGQTGSGHFSPVAAFDELSDSVLVMDVAKFKLPPHWLPVEALFQAMQAVDEITGKSRGWLLFSRRSSADIEPILHPFLIKISPLFSSDSCCWLPKLISNDRLIVLRQDFQSDEEFFRILVTDVLPIQIWTMWVVSTDFILSTDGDDDDCRDCNANTERLEALDSLNRFYTALRSLKIFALLSSKVEDWFRKREGQEGLPVIDDHSLLSLTFVLLCLKRELISFRSAVKSLFEFNDDVDCTDLIALEIERSREVFGLN